MFLAVTPIQDFWDKDDELTFIGPWCALYDRRPDWSTRRHRFLPDPWQDPRRFREASERCRGASEHLLGALSDHLNAALGISRSRRAWRILLDPWLTYHVEQMYDHFVHLEQAFRLFPEMRTMRLAPASYRTPRTTAEFVDMMVGDHFQLQMFSAILAFMRPDSPTKVHPAPAQADRPNTAKRLAKLAASRALSRSGSGRVFFSEVGLDRAERLRLIRGSGFRALPFLGELPLDLPPADPSDPRRRALARLPARDDFERLFVSVLPAHLPSIFLEGHAAARAATRANLRRIPSILFTTNGCHYDDAFKFAAAECVEAGGKLWGMQHGGAYGMVDYSPAEDFERGVSDRFYAWGWADIDGDRRVRNLPPPMLSRHPACAAGEDVVFVSTSLDLHNIRLCVNHEAAEEYIRRQARLMNSVPAPARAKLFFRLGVDWGLNHRARVRDLCPSARFEDRTIPLPRRLREARLAVFDCPSTPLLEALAADVPCVFSWEAERTPFRPSVAPFIEALRKVGILHESPEEAAAQIGRVYADPRAWWDEPQRRKAHRAFAETFARSSPDWLDAWLKEIREGLAER